MAVDNSWSNVVLLLPFAEDLINVKGHPATPVGGATLSAAHAPTGCTKSLQLDGNNDYLRLSIPGLAFGTGDFTIELPVYKSGDTVSGTANAGTLLDFRTAEPSVQILLNVAGSTDGTNPNKVVFYVNGVNRIVSATAMAASFKQITLARISGVTRLFIDGVQEGGDYADTNNYTGTALTIGGRFAAVSGDYRSFNGHLGPIRVTAGNGRGYSTTFTPPSFPLPRPMISGVVRDSTGAPVAKTILVQDRSTQRFLGGANSDATTGVYNFRPWDFGECIVTRLDELCDPMPDECVFNLDPTVQENAGGAIAAENTGHGPNHVLTFVGNAKISQDNRSFVFDGTGDCIKSGSYWYVLGLEDFSIEFEFYPIAGGRTSGSDNKIFTLGDNSVAGNLNINAKGSTNPLEIECEFYDTSYHTIGASSPTTYANDTWHKLRLRRVAGVFYLEINGTLVSTSAALAYNISQTGLTLGATNLNTANFYGNIGKVRINRGPRRAAASISNALLLTEPTDGGSGENAITYDRVTPGG
jgi:hypothetical protein